MDAPSYYRASAQSDARFAPHCGRREAAVCVVGGGFAGLNTALGLAYLVAVGIGVHNLGEGLAIGGAYAAGEVVLGAMLLLGFTIHNTTEGLAIVAPLTRSQVSLGHLALLGLIGGAPAIAGCWIGGFVYSDVWALLFLAIGAGAIFQVVWTIAGAMLSTARDGLVQLPNAAGFVLGMMLMYGTAMLITA